MNSVYEGIFAEWVSDEEVVLTIVGEIVSGKFLQGSIGYVSGHHGLNSLGGLISSTNGAMS